MEIPLWVMILAILGLTGIYLGLGYNGMWNYTTADFINGNLIIAGGIGFIYFIEAVYKNYKKEKN